jgi:hypothetical protein
MRYMYEQLIFLFIYAEMYDYLWYVLGSVGSTLFCCFRLIQLGEGLIPFCGFLTVCCPDKGVSQYFFLQVYIPVSGVGLNSSISSAVFTSRQK